MSQAPAEGGTTGSRVSGNAGIWVGIFCVLVEFLLLFTVYFVAKAHHPEAFLTGPDKLATAAGTTITALLRQVVILSRLTDEQLERLTRRTRLARLSAGETLFQHGDMARVMHLLVQRQLKPYRASAAGDEVIIDPLEAGMTFRDSRAFVEDPSFHPIRAALADAEVAAVDVPALSSAPADGRCSLTPWLLGTAAGASFVQCQFMRDL